ncbi:MAG TPA: hypothetical protein VL689_21400 [Paraburkholderia sp.]|nr:hypothetical protein [Paraburkholderia sp.]
MTDDDLGKFFRAKLAYAKPQVEPFVRPKTDRSCSSYFLDVFEPEPIVIGEDTIDALLALWRRQGLTSLALLEPELRRIAKALRAPEDESEVVSQFVYAMY